MMMTFSVHRSVHDGGVVCDRTCTRRGSHRYRLPLPTPPFNFRPLKRCHRFTALHIRFWFGMMIGSDDRYCCVLCVCVFDPSNCVCPEIVSTLSGRKWYLTSFRYVRRWLCLMMVDVGPHCWCWLMITRGLRYAFFWLRYPGSACCRYSPFYLRWVYARGTPPDDDVGDVDVHCLIFDHCCTHWWWYQCQLSVYSWFTCVAIFRFYAPDLHIYFVDIWDAPHYLLLSFGFSRAEFVRF